MGKEKLISQIETGIYKTSNGLTEEMFLFASTITPLINVDLLITDDQRRVLLAWRDDIYCGTGWHIPGGIIRHGETIDERIQRTAVSEIGCKVKYSEQPIKIVEQHLEQKERNHFVSLLYECYLDSFFSVDFANVDKLNTSVGYLKWFDGYPGDGVRGKSGGLIYSQHAYFDFLKNYMDYKDKEGRK